MVKILKDFNHLSINVCWLIVSLLTISLLNNLLNIS